MPSRPPATTSGSVAIPVACCTSSPASASIRVTDLPSSVCPAAPSSLSGAPEARGQPRAELERGPVVLGAAERHEHGLVRAELDRISLLGDQHGDVGRGVLEQLADVAERHALADQPPPALGEHEVDRLALDDVGEVGAGVRRGQRDTPGDDAVGGELLAQSR